MLLPSPVTPAPLPLVSNPTVKSDCCRQVADLRVLTYHRIGEEATTPELNPVTLSATAAGFERQMERLARQFHILQMSEVLERLEAGVGLPRRALLITFDDASRCFLDLAWPVLQRLGIPVTMFVPTAFPDSTREFWWDTVHRLARHAAREGSIFLPAGRLPAGEGKLDARGLTRGISRWFAQTPFPEAQGWLDAECARRDLPRRVSPVCTWDELRRLAWDGVELAPHTRTHPPLTTIAPELLRDEIEGSLEDLQREIVLATPVFAYPGGFYNEHVLHCLRQSPLQLAFTTSRGANLLQPAQGLDQANRLWLRRINVGRRSGWFRIWAQLKLPARLLNLLSRG